MMRPETEEDNESLLQRVRFLEDRVAALSSGGPVPQAAVVPGTAPVTAEARQTIAPASAPEVAIPEAAYEDYRQLAEDWQDICIGMPGGLRVPMNKATVSADESGRLIIYFSNQFGLESALCMDAEEELKKALTKRYGREFRLTFKALKEGENAPRVSKSRIPGIEMEIETSV